MTQGATGTPGRCHIVRHADRDLERELAQGPARQGRLVARAGPAGRAAAAGDQAHRRRRAARRLRAAGYELAHHGEGRWNGVAIAAAGADRRRGRQLRRAAPAASHSGRGRRRAARRGADDRGHLRGVRVVSLYAPNGRSLGSPFYQAKLAWFDRLSRWLEQACDPRRAAGPRRRLQRRARPTGRLGPGGVPRRDPRVAAGTRGLPPALPAGDSPTRTASITRSPAATAGGTTAPAPSTRTSACGSITCW